MEGPEVLQRGWEEAEWLRMFPCGPGDPGKALKLVPIIKFVLECFVELGPLLV